jgi:hypothetical protein
MLNRISITAFFTLMTFNAMSQTTWTFKDSKFIYKISSDYVPLGGTTGELGPAVNKIEIYNALDKNKIQTIKPEEFIYETFLDSSKVFKVEDMNFDNHNDIRLLNWTSTNLQTSYWYWLYNKNTGKFESDTTLEKFWNPYFDQVKKTIHKHWRIGLSEFGHANYKWTEKGIQLIAEQVEYWGMGGGSQGTLITRRFVDGKLIEKEIEVEEFTIHPHLNCDLK